MEKVLLYSSDVDATTKEVNSMGGTVAIQLGNDLLVARMPFDKVNSHFQTASTHVPKSASSQTLQYVKAYWKSVEAETMEEPGVHVWTDKSAPKSFPSDSPHKAGSTKQTMTGKITAVILVASGPGAQEVSDEEYNLIISECIAGVDFWQSQAPASASLSFTVYRAKASINVVDDPNCGGYAECHDRFAEPTLQYFGFSSVEELEDYVIDRSKAEGAFIGFFSKYTQAHFAYAYFGGGPLYMQYSNDGWGPNQIDRVFAHEIGHVFNSPDEYTSCSCNQLYGRGECTDRNSNCVTCTRPQQECIMNSNQYEVCPYTRKHLGWCE